MKLSNNTLAILKNFSGINAGLIFKPGNEIRTIHPKKTILAIADVEETFETVARIYDLNRFLAAYSLFEDPEIEFNEDHLVMRDGDSIVRVTYAGAMMVMDPPSKPKEELNVSTPIVSFDINWKTLESVVKAAGILKLADISFSCKDGELYVSAVNTKITADTYKHKIWTGECDNFDLFIAVENLRLLPNDYTVSIDIHKGIVTFSNKTLTYYIATEVK